MRTAKALFVLLLLLGLLLGGFYLSGLILFFRTDLPMAGLGVLSYPQYFWAHGDNALFGRTIRSSGLMGFAVPVLVLVGLLVLVLRNRKQNLYGDARFAELADLTRRGYDAFAANGLLENSHG